MHEHLAQYATPQADGRGRETREGENHHGDRGPGVPGLLRSGLRRATLRVALQPLARRLGTTGTPGVAYILRASGLPARSG